MRRLVVFACLSTLIAAPAMAQVINGETPLDETSLNRETPNPAVAPHPAMQSPSAAEPARSDPPQPATRHD